MKTTAVAYKRFNIVYDNLSEFLADVGAWIALGYTFSFWAEMGRVRKPNETLEVAYQKEVALTLADR